MTETLTNNNLLEQAFGRVKSRFRKETTDLKQQIENAPEATEVADVAFTDFKNKLFQKKTTDKNGKEQQYYSAQLLGTVDFFGETLLKPLLESKYIGEKDFLKTMVSKVKYEWMFQSLINSGISEREQAAFKADFEAYLGHIRTNIKTKEDLEALKNGNIQLTQDYEVAVKEQLEQQVQAQISVDRQTYIETEKKDDPEWTESSLVVPNRIGVVKKSFPVLSKPFERSKEGTTLCSKTAWLNGQTFGINLPRLGSARESLAADPISPAFQLTIQDAQKLKSPDFSKLAPQSNFVDLSVVSNTSAGRMYGHRAVAFLNQKDHQRYVLDPYTGNNF